MKENYEENELKKSLFEFLQIIKVEQSQKGLDPTQNSITSVKIDQIFYLDAIHNLFERYGREKEKKGDTALSNYIHDPFEDLNHCNLAVISNSNQKIKNY
jgi:hypothetical protein